MCDLLCVPASLLRQSWCSRIGRSPRELMMAVSFSAMVGGTMTVIGAPVNLLLNGLVLAHDPTLVRYSSAPCCSSVIVVSALY